MRGSLIERPYWSVSKWVHSPSGFIITLICLPGLEKSDLSQSHAWSLINSSEIAPHVAFARLNTFSPGGLVFFTDRRHRRDCKENPKPPQGEHEEAASGGLHPGQGRHRRNCRYAIFLFGVLFLSAYLHTFSTRSHPIFGPFWTSLPFT